MTDYFVFGSNLAGIHGAGSAKEAVKNHGAVYGQGVGPQGKSYGIPTKDTKLDILPLSKIKPYVLSFLDYAKSHSDDTFNVVAIGCGFAGYKPEDIAPMFEGYPENVNLPKEFIECLS